jgi:hypothetical protein
MGGCNGNCFITEHCKACGHAFCSFGGKCDRFRGEAYWIGDDPYCISCYETVSTEQGKLQTKVNELIETLKSKYEDKVETEILEEMILEIRTALISKEESESAGDNDW